MAGMLGQDPAPVDSLTRPSQSRRTGRYFSLRPNTAVRVLLLAQPCCGKPSVIIDLGLLTPGYGQ